MAGTIDIIIVIIINPLKTQHSVDELRARHAKSAIAMVDCMLGLSFTHSAAALYTVCCIIIYRATYIARLQHLICQCYT